MDKKGRPWPKIVVEQWDYEKNGSVENYNLGSHSKVFWRCFDGKCGNVHEWEAIIKNRTKKKNPTSCPYCSNQKICSCFCNSLWKQRPDLRKEWNEEKNGSMKEYSLNSGKKVWWKCNKGKCGHVHEWETSICDRTGKKQRGCPYCCSNSKVCPCLCNSLWTLRPDLRKEWIDEKNGSMKKYCLNSHKKVWWKCNKGKCGHVHEWEATINSRTGKNQNGCPICDNKQICKFFCNSFWNKNINLKEEWNEEKNGSMKKYCLNSNKKVWWKCNKGKCGHVHEWETSIGNRTKNGNGCPICYNQKICPYFCNSLWALRPDLRKEWIDEKNGSMKKYSLNNGKKVWWKCEKSHKWDSVINSRTGKPLTGCPICSSSKLEKSFSKSCKTLTIKYNREYRLSIPQISSRRFDFYIEPNILVEMDGIQHFQHVHYFHRNLKTFKKRLNSDLIKSIYPWKHNYNLLRIAYTINHDDIPQIIKDFIELTSTNSVNTPISTDKVHRYYATKDEYINITNNIIWHNYVEEELTDETKEVLEVYSSHINFLC